jgi:hypothetical protein
VLGKVLAVVSPQSITQHTVSLTLYEKGRNLSLFNEKMSIFSEILG